MNLFLMHLFVDAARSVVAGATLGAPSWYRPVLVVPFTPPRGRGRYLVAVLESPGPFAWVTDAAPFEGAQAPARFAPLSGRRVTAWERVGGDRVIRIDTGPGPNDAPGALSLSLHLYGSRGSAILERAGVRLETVGARRADDWRPARRRTLVDIDADSLDTAISLTDVDGAHSPAAVVPGADRDWVSAFTSADGSFDAAGAVAFRDAVAVGGTPFLLVSAGKAGNAVVLPESSAPEDAVVRLGPFPSALDACRALGEHLLVDVKERMIAALAQPLRRRLAASRRLLENLRGDLEAARGHERVRREAEILAAYQSTIPPGTATIELEDIYEPGVTVHVALDPGVPIQKQIEKRFRKATKLEKSTLHTSRRIELVQREIEELQAAVRLLESETSLATSLLHLDALRDRFGLERPAGPRTPGARPGERRETPGRRFDLGGGWYALVGRNNHENDDLTFRHAAPGDLWFHAQSIPGSHVVLKTSRPSGAPPARVIEMTASLAAHFSKARHSRLVPVIYTQRKYVRKFRGAKAGQVICEREKMVMVPPSVPDTPGDG